MPSVTKVYAGLSAEPSDVKTILPSAIVAPPVRRGDICTDMKRGVNRILILDGRFHQSLSAPVDTRQTFGPFSFDLSPKFASRFQS